MDDMITAYAPYNFVPFPNKFLIYQGSLPPHNMIDSDLWTGEIRVTMKAETPVFVSDGCKVDPRFFKGANNKYAIPGSSVRGMVRENMQILGFGLIRPGEDIDDYTIYFRNMTARSNGSDAQLKQYYRSVLAVTTERSQSGKTFSVPKKVESGYLYKDGSEYLIRPTKGQVLRVSRKHKDMAAFGEGNARAIQVAYKASGDIIKSIVSIDKAAPDMKRGMLLFTGEPIDKRRPNHLYVFPEPDFDVAPLPISKEDKISYAADWENRRNSLKAKFDPDFWALPKSDGEEMKPVFYLHHEGHLYFGMSRYLRIGYKHPMTYGLPKNLKEFLGTSPEPLDYPHAILGYTRNKESYRSRVSFTDFEALGNPVEMQEKRTVLGQPKPSFYTGYVVDGENYNEDDFLLRGYKHYWLKEAAEVSTNNEKENVASRLHPLQAGTTFSGVVRFKNLKKEELGLLLWSLRLDNGCYQSIGMGKPYGYGRMSLTINSLRKFNTAQMYNSESLSVAGEDITSKIDELITAYDEFAAKHLCPQKSPTIRSLDVIKDFIFIHREIRSDDEVNYMTLEEYKNINKALPDIASVRRESENKNKANQNKATDGDQPASEEEIKRLVAKYSPYRGSTNKKRRK